MTRPLALVLLVAAVVRLGPILVADRVTADVLRYKKLATHVLDVSWNPYEAPRLYPYPPVWVAVEAAAEWLARRTAFRFAVLVKLPVLLADLGLVALLARMGAGRGLGLWPAWLYALHPVSILVTGFHGQFDAAALLCVLLAVHGFEAGRHDRAALALAGGIALKSFPVLLLPFFLLARHGHVDLLLA
jgi:Gpi18-like mannosyltransferase